MLQKTSFLFCGVSQMEELAVFGSYLPHDASEMASWNALKARVQPLGMVMLCVFSLVPWLVKHKRVTRLEDVQRVGKG